MTDTISLKKLYEGMFLFDSNLASKDWPGLEKHVEDLLGRHSGELVHAERWPDRKLAYEISGCKKGTYYLTYFNAPPESIDALRRDCDLSDRVMRVMFLHDEVLLEACEKRKQAATAEEQEGEGESKSDDTGAKASGEGEPSAPAATQAASATATATAPPQVEESPDKPQNT